MMALDAATELATVLRLENAALERHDFQAAGALLDRKQSAVQAFADGPAGRAMPAGPLRELAALVDANRRLLDRAMAVQRQVVGLVARSAAGTTPGRYGRGGAGLPAAPGRALTARA